MRTIVLFLLGLLASYYPYACGGSSPNWTAASAELAAVDECVDVAVTDGDIINVPADDATWAGGLSTITEGITIIGAGPGLTNITRGTGGALIATSLGPDETFRLSGITFIAGGAGATPAIGDIIGSCDSAGCSRIRIDNIALEGGWSLAYGPFMFRNVFGVIHNNTFTGNFIFAKNDLSSYKGVGFHGDKSWAEPDTYGEDVGLFFEDNDVFGEPHIALTDNGNTNSGGARMIARFNRLYNTSLQTHGTESSGRDRSVRHFEFYKNEWNLSANEVPVLIGIRGGTGVAVANTIQREMDGDFDALMSIVTYRDANPFSPWDSCNGGGDYDDNDGMVYDSGTVTSTSIPFGGGTSGLIVEDNTKNWTADQWVAFPPYSIWNVDKGQGANITSMTGDDTVNSSNYYGKDCCAVAWDIGDDYQILKVDQCIDQAGAGAGDYISGNPTPTPTGWVNQAFSPILVLGNSSNSAPDTGWATVNATSPARFQPNVNYFDQVSGSAQTTSTSPFDGSEGTGYGTLANRPTNCNEGVAYWATDVGEWNSENGATPDGKMFQCIDTDTWTARWGSITSLNDTGMPLCYPHPMITGMPCSEGGGQQPGAQPSGKGRDLNRGIGRK